jgi:hypothetical protein
MGKKKYKLSLAGLEKFENQIEELNEPEIISFNEEDSMLLNSIYDNNLYNQERNDHPVFEAGDRFYSEENML